MRLSHLCFTWWWGALGRKIWEPLILECNPGLKISLFWHPQQRLFGACDSYSGMNKLDMKPCSGICSPFSLASLTLIPHWLKNPILIIFSLVLPKDCDRRGCSCEDLSWSWPGFFLPSGYHFLLESWHFLLCEIPRKLRSWANVSK